MDSLTPIFLAASDGPGLDVIIWVVAGGIWVLTQIAAAKKKKERKERQAQQSPPPAGQSSNVGDAPTPDDLAEIFARLGADIPSTPPPRPTAARSTPPPPPRRRMPVDYTKVRKIEPDPVRPEIAQRLARVKREAAEAARQAEAQPVTSTLKVPSAVSQVEGSCAQHTGAILPRFYAMGMQLAPLPSLPMPSANRTNHSGTPFPVHLHSRLDLRNAVVAQVFLSPAKASEL